MDTGMMMILCQSSIQDDFNELIHFLETSKVRRDLGYNNNNDNNNNEQ